jgi:DNA-binding Lrp family transcriptional regulator
LPGERQRVLCLEKDSTTRDAEMPTAFVLINTELGTEMNVLKDIKKVNNVEEAFAVYGTYDIVVRVRADTMERLKETVSSHIRKVNNVRATLTLLSSEDTK